MKSAGFRLASEPVTVISTAFRKVSKRPAARMWGKLARMWACRPSKAPGAGSALLVSKRRACARRATAPSASRSP